LTACREGLISDLGPGEEDLNTAQKILIDRVIGKLGVLRCLEEYAREKGVIKEGKLSFPLEHNFLGWSNSLRLDLQALGIDARAGEKILSPLEIAAEIDAENAEKSTREAKANAERPVAASADSPECSRARGRGQMRMKAAFLGGRAKNDALECP